MKNFLFTFTLLATLACCSNTPELETGEIKTLQLLKQTFEQANRSQIFVDSRDLLNREQIDAAKTPVLFVELTASGQNGTLTPYPGQGIGTTWLGADGATLTLERGIIKATRGMGDDVMGSSLDMPAWPKIKDRTRLYNRKISYLSGDNKITERSFDCKIQKKKERESITVWGLKFRVIKFEETCNTDNLEIKNFYYLDNQNIVRKSLQYHSETIGYLNLERLDR